MAVANAQVCTCQLCQILKEISGAQKEISSTDDAAAIVFVASVRYMNGIMPCSSTDWVPCRSLDKADPSLDTRRAAWVIGVDSCAVSKDHAHPWRQLWGRQLWHVRASIQPQLPVHVAQRAHLCHGAAPRHASVLSQVTHCCFPALLRLWHRLLTALPKILSAQALVSAHQALQDTLSGLRLASCRWRSKRGAERDSSGRGRRGTTLSRRSLQGQPSTSSACYMCAFNPEAARHSEALEMVIPKCKPCYTPCIAV